MENKKCLLLDVDEVICFSNFLEYINEFLNTNYVIDDFTDYYIDEAVIPPEKMSDFNSFIANRNLYSHATILPDAIEVIEKLNEIYDIYICSSCVNPFDIPNSGRIFCDKYNFLLKNIPFIKPEKYIFTSTKNIFKADIQIDDRLNNFDSDIPLKILVSSYHNMDISPEELKSKNIIRAGTDWRNTWQGIFDILINNK